jgi:hypothetical protein
VKSRKVVEATRRLDSRWLMMLDGEISFGEFDASVLGRINPIAQVDSWMLRRKMLEPYAVPVGERGACGAEAVTGPWAVDPIRIGIGRGAKARRQVEKSFGAASRHPWFQRFHVPARRRAVAGFSTGHERHSRKPMKS